MIGHIRRETKDFCNQHNCNTIKEDVAIVVTELASNALKHAKDGSIIIKEILGSKYTGIEIIYMDKGPGFDTEKVVQDGFSTAGSLGVGLGSIQRLSDECHFYSHIGKGTCIVCRLFEKSKQKSVIDKYINPETFSYSHICVPIVTESYCGDDVAVYITKEYALAMVVDGLGHGEFAHQAAIMARDIFFENTDSDPEDIIASIDNALYSTRGAACSIAKIIPSHNKVIYTGVGNISGAIVGQKRINMVSHNGTLGMRNNKIQTFTYPWNKYDMLIMHSDGISAKWSLDEYPDIAHKDLSIINAVIFRDYHRPKDDASLLVLKEV